MAEALDAGHAKVWLEEQKLGRGWTLRTAAARSRSGCYQAPGRFTDARHNPHPRNQSVRISRTVGGCGEVEPLDLLSESARAPARRAR